MVVCVAFSNGGRRDVLAITNGLTRASETGVSHSLVVSILTSDLSEMLFEFALVSGHADNDSAVAVAFSAVPVDSRLLSLGFWAF